MTSLPSWRARLQTVLFGQQSSASDMETSSGIDANSLVQQVEASEAQHIVSSATVAAPTAVPIVIASDRQESTRGAPQGESSSTERGSHSSEIFQESKDSRSSDAPSSSSTASSKRKSLQALLGGPGDERVGPPATLTTGLRAPTSTERISTSRPPLTQRKSSSDEPIGSFNGGRLESMPSKASTSRTKSAQTPPSLSSSLTQGVKTLSERYASKKEASETFKTMREASSSSPLPLLDRGSSPRHSRSSSEISRASLHRSTSSPEPPKSDKAAQDECVPAMSGGNADAGRRRASSSIPDSSPSRFSDPQRLEPVHIPQQLIDGEPMLKVTSKKVKQRIVHIDADAGQILWDSKKNNRVNFEAIREVRTGIDARTHRTSLSIAQAHESRWVSIIYQAAGIYKALHLIALSDESLERWRDTLADVQKERQMLASCVDMFEQRQNMWLRRHFKSADASSDSRLDFDEVARMCRRLGIMSNRLDLRGRFDEADKDGSGYLDFASFQHFVDLLKRRPEVEQLFNVWADDAHAEQGSLAVSTRTMSADRFCDFLRTEQGYEKANLSSTSDVFKKFCSAGMASMDLSGFSSFLMSSDNALLTDQNSLATKHSHQSTYPSGGHSSSTEVHQHRAHAETAEELIAISGQARVTHDMTRPLAEYYISSSHNTYLVGGQLTGESTTEGYVRALMQGARSVELDCWDGPSNDPVVTHGRTLTTKVPLRDVIEAIGRYAFVASPYPLILSLEIHNDLTQQNIVADILRSVLGDKLLQEPLVSQQQEGQTIGQSSVLPSPRQLMGKILVKAKNLLLTQPSEDSERSDVVVQLERGSTSATTDTTDTDNDGFLHNARDLVRSVTKRRNLSRNRRKEKSDGSMGDKDKKVPMSPALTSLLIYTIGVKHRGINKKETYAVEHMISLSERSALKYAKSAPGGPNRDDLIKHNRSHLTRIYPSMHSFARLSYSANFLPCLFWSMGCQLVALNWQTVDMGFEMNQAMFARNGRSGYVLKPDALRHKESSMSKLASNVDVLGLSNALYVVVEVTIISAQQLPRSRDGTSTTSNGSSDGQSNADDVPVINPFVSVAVTVPDAGQAFGVVTGTDCAVAIPQDRTSTDNGVQSMSREGTTPATHDATQSKAKLAAATKFNSPRKLRTTGRLRTTTVRQNGFNPIWNETVSFRVRLPAVDSVGMESGDVQRATRGLLDLCFLRFEARNEAKPDSGSGGAAEGHSRSGSGSAHDGRAAVSSPVINSTRDVSTARKARSGAPSVIVSSNDSAEHSKARRISQPESSLADVNISDDNPCLASYMISLGAMEQGYHHVPLYDGSMTQHLFSTLFVRTKLRIDNGV